MIFFLENLRRRTLAVASRPRESNGSVNAQLPKTRRHFMTAKHENLNENTREWTKRRSPPSSVEPVVKK